MLETIYFLKIHINLIISFTAHVIFFYHFFCFSPGNALTSGGSRLFDTKTNPERKPLEIPSEFPFVCTLLLYFPLMFSQVSLTMT